MEKTRQTLEQQTGEVRTAIEEKLKTASVQRDENIKKMLERLREHVSRTLDTIDVSVHHSRSHFSFVVFSLQVIHSLHVYVAF